MVIAPQTFYALNILDFNKLTNYLTMGTGLLIFLQNIKIFWGNIGTGMMEGESLLSYRQFFLNLTLFIV